MPPSFPEPADDISTLERLRRKLYAPASLESTPSPALSEKPVAVAREEGWAPPPAPVAPKKPKVSWAALFLGIASVFFIGALAAAAYFLFLGGRAVSPDSVIITLDAGSANVGSGDTVTLFTTVENKNPVPITATRLLVSFPESARAPDDATKSLAEYEDTLGDIAPGATGERSVRAVLFGSEGERIAVPVRFEYRVEGSNAVFVKEAMYEFVITSSPISIRAEAVSEASAGQPLSFAVTVRSNVQTPVERVAVLTRYPFGFTPRRGEGPLYQIGTLAPGEEKTVTVTGVLSGEDGDERAFTFEVGTLPTPDATAFAAPPFASTKTMVSLAKPFLATTLTINRETAGTTVIEAGTPVQAVVSWVNALSVPVLDGQISVKLTGAALDPASVNAFGGYYRSSDTSILFSRETASGLARLAPGDGGNGSFSFATKPTQALIGARNQTITATVSVAGRRVDESNVPEAVTSSVVRTMQVGTDLTLAARTLRTIGAFKNTGPWPPVADQETTYTIELALKNTLNNTADVTVSGTLPSYVRFTGATNPADSGLTYNATTRTVSWRVGDVAAGTGYGSTSRTASFQVALLPSASQRGTSPILMSGMTISGVDLFTKKSLTKTHPELTTQALSDPGFQQDKGSVR